MYVKEGIFTQEGCSWNVTVIMEQKTIYIQGFTDLAILILQIFIEEGGTNGMASLG